MATTYELLVEHKQIHLDEELGIDKWAFNKAASLRVLHLRKLAQLPCRSVDVLVRQSDRFQFTFNNWRYDGNIKHMSLKRQRESVENAESFIQRYKDEKDKEYFFIIS